MTETGAGMPSVRKVLEAILFLAENPVPGGLLGELLEKPRGEVEALLVELAQRFEAEDRGWRLLRAAGGWRLYTDPACDPYLERFVLRDRSARLSAAAREVLALVAYRGPISRAQIAEVRGVDSDGVVRTLEARGLIRAVEGGSAGPVSFEVSQTFLERMGLDSVEDLPPLSQFMPDTETVEDLESRLSPGA